MFDDHAVHTEMPTDSVVVAVIGAGAAPDVGRVLAALDALSDTGAAGIPPLELPEPGPPVVSLREAYLAPAELVPADRAVGRLSADALAAYPPGIPNVLPGELITAATRDFLQRTAASPFGHVRGAADPHLECMRVLVAPASTMVVSAAPPTGAARPPRP